MQPKTYLNVSRFYKNKVDEKPGWNDQVLKWCLEAALENGLKEGDYWGGFLIDEMKIQVRGRCFTEQFRQLSLAVLHFIVSSFIDYLLTVKTQV